MPPLSTKLRSASSFQPSLAGERLPREMRNYIAALAPIIDNESAAGATGLARLTAQSWREAPLFAAQPARSCPADAALLAPRSGAHFVAPGHRGGRHEHHDALSDLVWPLRATEGEEAQHRNTTA